MNLTPKQQDVYAWVLQGLTNKQIGKRLNMAESTIKIHMTKILQQYGVQNRLQLIAFAKQGVANTIVPVDVEEHPFGWVKLKPYGISGFVMGVKSPADGWEPVYLRRSE
jgi:DNA-binding CsgD family transcriptional regulator